MTKDTPKFHLLRGANVEVKDITTGSGKTRTRQAEIIVDDRFVHRFDSKSRISKHLDVMTAKDLGERLSGGSYFFIDEANDEATAHLIDHRNGQYMQKGFVHTDETVSKFMEVLGFMRKEELPMHRRKRNEEPGTSNIILRKQWSNGEIQVPGYAQGGDFNSRLSFTWSPFQKTVDSSFDLIRLICTNGAVGLTSFLNTKIPLENRWEEHLEIASRQIQNKVGSIVIQRVKEMTKERASVGECLLVEKHIFDRLYAPGEKAEGEREMLLKLLHAVSPETHLSGLYQKEVFANRALAAQLGGHLSHFDLWNIATEVRSHTSSSKDSTDNALDKLANSLMFDADDNFSVGASQGGAKLSAFSNPDQAFFGRM